VTSAAGDSRRGPPRAEESAERRRLQQAFRDDEQYDETLWKFDGPGDFERRLAVLRFPWEPGVGTEKLVALPYESLGECLVGRGGVRTRWTNGVELRGAGRDSRIVRAWHVSTSQLTLAVRLR